MNIYIRPFQEKDRIPFIENYSDVRDNEYFNFYNPTRTKWSKLTTFNENNCFFVIVDSITDELVGTIFAQRNNKSLPYKVEFSTLPKYTKQRCGKQAFRLLIEYLKDNYNIDYVTLSVDNENKASIKLIESLKDKFNIGVTELFEKDCRIYFVKEKTKSMDTNYLEDNER